MQLKGIKTLKTGNKLALNWKLILKKFTCPLTLNIYSSE